MMFWMAYGSASDGLVRQRVSLHAWVAIRPSNRIWRELQNVIKWLVQIQQPELFQAINTFSLKNANEPPTLTLELEVARWYAPNP